MRGLSTTSVVSAKLSKLGGLFISTGRAMTLGLTLPIVALGGSLIGAGIQFEDAFSGVLKTVDGASAGVRDVIMLTPELNFAVTDLMNSINAMGAPGQEITFNEALDLFIANLSEADRKMIFSSDLFGTMGSQALLLRDGLREMSLEIPIAADELARVAQVAGELGIPIETVEEFTRVAALMGLLLI
jgi:hypothetical protein